MLLTSSFAVPFLCWTKGFLSRSFHLESASDEVGCEPLSCPSNNVSSPSVFQEADPTLSFQRTPLSPRSSGSSDVASDIRRKPCLESAVIAASHARASVAYRRSVGSNDSREDSPKLPPSPVLRTLRAERPSPIDIRGKRDGKIGRKISGLLDSSSSEDEDEVSATNFPRKKSSSTDESTPSPRTPNSCKILSGIEKNQATAFYFPPSPFRSRPSSLEKERQSSQLSDVEVSSLRSRSTSSEVFDDAVSGLVTPLTTRSHRMNPLRKQAAIAEESCQDQQPFSSAADSGLSDGPPATPPTNSRTHSRVSNVSSQSDSRECLETAISLSENEETTTNTIFRKVTIKKRVAPIPSRQSTSSSPTLVPLESEIPRPASEPLSSSCRCESDDCPPPQRTRACLRIASAISRDLHAK